MIEEDIRRLSRREADHALDSLETHIWARLAARERTRRQFAGLAALQTILLGAVFGASALAGRYYGVRSHSTHELSVFSTDAPLSSSTLLGGRTP